MKASGRGSSGPEKKGSESMGIYVWGTGCGASQLISRGLELGRISAFVDSFPQGGDFLGRPVLRPEELPVSDCELLIVTSRHSGDIAEQCGRLGLGRERILFLKNHCRPEDMNASCTAAEKLLGRELLQRLLPRQRIISTPERLSSCALSEAELSGDYVRLSALELICRRLDKRVPGAAAELGVYRGDFARCINTLLPGRTLYLFDSFSGFAPGDGAEPAFQAAHENTSAEAVLARMPHPETVRLYPGYFPASLKGLEERFCLVSLDVDFAGPTLEGLRWFWPRLNTGGYLLLHDWGNPELPGVAQALEQYEVELGSPIPALPLPDIGGSLVLCK